MRELKLREVNNLIKVIKSISGQDGMRICLSAPEPLPFSVFRGSFLSSLREELKKARCKPAAVTCSWGGEGRAPLGKPAVVSAGAEICSKKRLEPASEGTRWRSWTAPSFSGLRPSLGVLVFSWGDVNSYTDMHFWWLLLAWISGSLSSRTGSSPFGTVITLALLVVLR